MIQKERLSILGTKSVLEGMWKERMKFIFEYFYENFILLVLLSMDTVNLITMETETQRSLATGSGHTARSSLAQL